VIRRERPDDPRGFTQQVNAHCNFARRTSFNPGPRHLEFFAGIGRIFYERILESSSATRFRLPSGAGITSFHNLPGPTPTLRSLPIRYSIHEMPRRNATSLRGRSLTVIGDACLTFTIRR
jgi:hypothetical protein